MPIVDDVTAAIAEAMRKQDSARLVPLRMLKAAFMKLPVEKGVLVGLGRTQKGRQE